MFFISQQFLERTQSAQKVANGELGEVVLPGQILEAKYRFDPGEIELSKFSKDLRERINDVVVGLSDWLSWDYINTPYSGANGNTREDTSINYRNKLRSNGACSAILFPAILTNALEKGDAGERALAQDIKPILAGMAEHAKRLYAELRSPQERYPVLQKIEIMALQILNLLKDYQPS